MCRLENLMYLSDTVLMEDMPGVYHFEPQDALPATLLHRLTSSCGTNEIESLIMDVGWSWYKISW